MLKETKEKLLDVSRAGKVRNWRDRKRSSVRLSQKYEELDLKKLSRKVYLCSELLVFKKFQDESLKLKKAWFCKNNLCPLCSWRRAMKYREQLRTILKESLKRKKGTFLFLTLTQKNVFAEDLAAELDLIHKSFRKLTRRAFFKKSVIGFVRATEITYNEKEGTYHPHIHVLLFVSSSYFKSSTGLYKTQKEWVKLWRDSLKIDYDPSVNIKKVKTEDNNLIKSVLEVSKYTVKPLDYDKTDSEVIETLYFSMFNKRLISFGGLFKEIRNELFLDDPETGNLVDVSEENEIEEDKAVREIIAKYNYFKRDYFIQNHEG
jgi:plasmid rolling circle replication initiator protein Rep